MPRSGKYSYPDWLAKTGKPVYWAYQNINGPRIVSKSVVKFHQKGRVYLVGSCYAIWASPSDIEQIHGREEGDYLPEAGR